MALTPLNEPPSRLLTKMLSHFSSRLNTLPSLSLLLILLLSNPTTTASSSSIIDEAILKDMITFRNSPRCPPNDATTNTRHTFTYTPSTSPWHAETTSTHESSLFLAELKHADQFPARSWTIRIGRGGNIYSFTGPYGENVPPQHHPKAPWIDEVWQTVSVNSEKNNKKKDGWGFFIHQAGAYQDDGDYTTNPFYSPTLAKHCSNNECLILSWGTLAPIPTRYKSDVLYLNRYTDCGNGVLEVTSAVYNAGPDSPDEGESDDSNDLTYINIPWGGVRHSSLRDILISKPGGGSRRLWPLQWFGQDDLRPKIKETGGYVIFAQHLKIPEGAYYKMPTVTQKGTFAVKDDDDDDGPGSPSVSGANNNTCDNDKEPTTAATTTTTVEEASLRLFIKDNNTAAAPPFHCEKNGKYTIRVALRDALTIPPDGGFTSDNNTTIPNLRFVNPRTGKSFTVNTVTSWAHNGAFLFFCPNEEDITADVMNEMFLAGDEIVVEPDLTEDEGMEDDKNMALGHVFGMDWEHQRKMHRAFRVPSMLRLGYAGKNNHRDYTVYTVNWRGSLKPTEMYVYRQYFITDKFNRMDQRASSWAMESQQRIFVPQQYKVRRIQLILNNGDDDVPSFGARLASDDDDDDSTATAACVGFTAPRPRTKALFYITCGESKHYVGMDKYHFAPEQVDKMNDPIRSYACDGEDASVRPTWKLLGFFIEGDCDELSDGVVYDDKFGEDGGDEDVEEEVEEVKVDVREEL